MNFSKDKLKKLIVCFLMIVCMVSAIQTINYAACFHSSGRRMYEDQGDGRHKIMCGDCGYRISQAAHSYGSWKTTRTATCTKSGKETRKCRYCSASETRYTSKASHDWSSWKKNSTDHWKECHNCGETDDEGSHYDNNIDGYCDACNYLMAIPGAANISSDVSVKEGESASFSISLIRGTAPVSYQWYYNTTNSINNGVPISGATSTSVSTGVTNKNMNGRYYYCAMTNKAGTTYSPTAKLTVYYPFSLGTQPQSVNVKNGETAKFSVSIGTAGNPNSYSYQWYVASSETANGSKINGATGASYSIKPTRNIHEEYYYCVVSNGQYTVTSNRAKLVADITLPEITMGTFEDNRIINNTVTIGIPFTVTDTGEGYTEDGTNFISDDIVVKVGGVIPSGLNKTLDFVGEENGAYKYKLTLSNISGNGNLSVEVPASSVEDNFHNQNALKTFSTRLTIDNIAPVISFESITSGLNGKYANAEDTLIIRLIVTEAVGLNTGLFTESDIDVLVGEVSVNTDLEKKLVYLEKQGNQYIYQLTLTKVKGEGELSLNIPIDSFVDLANNSNVVANLDVMIDGSKVVIDNTKPVINSLVTTLGGYNSSRDYPTSIEANHQNWARENIYSQINATDNQEIDYYLKSINGTNYSEMTSNQEEIKESIETIFYYKVVDLAGNVSDPIFKEVKLDKITPDKPVILITEQREGGAPYVYDVDVPTKKSIYVKPNAATVIDKGSVQSGIATSTAEPKVWTYYIITRYKEKGDTNFVSQTTHHYNEGVLLTSSGYYEVKMLMEDIAGNKTESDLYQIYIEKGAENTIRIKNLNDIGSGVKKATIRIYSVNKYGDEVITPIVVENPYKEIVKNVRLGDGSFYVEVTLIDKVGNTTVLSKTIQNKL